MKPENAQFYRDILNALQSDSLAIFAGAGLSKSAGYVDWKGLLRDIATDLGLSVDKEYDLISVAQYNVNKIGGRSMLNEKIIEEFNEDVQLTENHRILSRLPIHTFWTTNYDDLLERALKEAKRIPDIKHSIDQLNFSKPRRDAVVYKMHGDQTQPDKAVLTKDDYESYFQDRAMFVNILSGDLVSKRFLFLGFSFTDPNLDYVLSRVRLQMRSAQRHHYYFIKRVQKDDSDVVDDADFIYKNAKQEHFIQDLKRHKLQPVFVETYEEITEILEEIESIFKKRTVFISGSAEEYGYWDNIKAQGFIHKLSKRLIAEGYRIVNGFGWGVGSAVINGALEEIYRRPEKYSEDLLIVKPFPQFATGSKQLPELWNEYRREMLKYAGIAIYLFGNKINPENPEKREIINASGVRKEFDIANEYGMVHVPVKATSYMSAELFDELSIGKYFDTLPNKAGEHFQMLGSENDPDMVIEHIISALKELNK